MPDISGLYPQPQQQTQGALGGDPLRLIGALGGINQAMLFAKTFQARQALGDAWSKNLQPDGTPNLAGVAQDLKKNPNANFLLPEATSNILEQHGKMIANDTASFDQYAKQSDFVQQWLARRATQPNVTSEDVLNDLVTLSRNTDPRVLPSSVLNSVGSSILSDPKGVRTGIVNLANRVRGAASATAPVQGPPGAGGATTTIPGGAGLYPPAPGAKAAPTIPGQVTTGLPPGSEASAGVMQGDLVRAGNYASDIFPLQKALDLAKSLGPGGMGPGSKGRQEFESFVYSLMPQLVPQEMQNKIKNYAELEKYLVNNTQNRAQNLGPHTNEGLATAVTGSPNVHINDLAGVDLIKAQLALRKMEQSQIVQASQGSPANYTAAKAQIAAQQDPRAYHIENMSPDEIATLKKTLKGPERARFNSSLRAAINSGVITPPGQ